MFRRWASLLGTVVAARLEERIGPRATLRTMLALGVASYAALALTAEVVLVTVLLGLYFFHTSVWTICFASWRQRIIPDRLMGRVNGAMRTFSLAGLVAGSVSGGILASRFGLQSPFSFGAALLVAALLLPLGRSAAGDDTPATTWSTRPAGRRTSATTRTPTSRPTNPRLAP